MKNQSKPRKKPAASSERAQEILDAARFHAERIDQETKIDSQRTFSNKPAGNAEFEQAIAEDVNFKIDDKIAEAAFLIAQRRDFAPGKETSDWLQAESNIEGVLVERRNAGCGDRRQAGTKDRRH